MNNACKICGNGSGDECPLCRERVIDLKIDTINHPAHYLVGGIETLDYIKAKLDFDEYKGYLKGCIIKYLSRANHKGHPLEDYRKAKFYMDKLVELAGEDEKCKP